MIDLKEYFGFWKKRKMKEYFAFGNYDMTFLILVIFLMFAGLVMVYSSSYVIAMNDSSGDVGNNPYYYIKKQALIAFFGILLMYVVSRINHLYMKEFSVLVLIISIIMLIVVLRYHVELPGRPDIARAFVIPIIGQFQPSELAKLGLVMFCAWGMTRRQKQIEKRPKMLIPYIAVIAVMCGLVMAENHLSGTILICCIGAVMLILSGVKLRWVIVPGSILIVLGIAAVFCMWLIVNNPNEARKYLPEKFIAVGTLTEHTPYTVIRIIGWLDKDLQPMGARWQINNSLYAISSGGFLGKGIGNSIQKHMFLSEANNDFVFAIICEELGFVGGLAVIALFGLLVWRGFVIAIKAKDRFGSLLVMGIVFQVGLQAALHIAVVTDTIPNTGISLPFFSTGGSSMLILFVEMGMVLSVSRSAKMRKS
ncbi:MAG: putative peptidoglycan glycosyltransferase FtsW [Eubacteriales bacterium]